MDREAAAIAASTAQGWAHALNTVARPHAEHLEAAQEALNALEAADRHAPALGVQARWPGVRKALSEALEAARLRVSGNAPRDPGAITIAELAGALAELRALGLAAPDVETVPRFVADGALASRAERIEELEAELELASQREGEEREARELTDAALSRLTDLRDRFERERNQLARDLKAAHAGHSRAVDAAREEQDRQRLRWILGQLGFNTPGYDLMPLEELRETATQAIGGTLKEAQALRLVAKELRRAVQLVEQGYDGAPYQLPADDQPVELAALVVRLAVWSRQARSAALARQGDLEQEVADLRHQVEQHQAGYAPEVAAARQERDDVARSRDVQARELRTLRAELSAARDGREEAMLDAAATQTELDHWTGAALELIRQMEPGHCTGEDGAELRGALATAVRRQLDRVEAIGQRLGREEQISAAQRQRAEVAEAERDMLRQAVERAAERGADPERAGTFHQLTTRALIEELDG
jgi:hypothetical protein